MSATAVVECTAVCLRYRSGYTERTVLSNISVSLAPGDVVGLTGTSGSGKTSLIHLLAGLESPTSGSVEWPMIGGRPAAGDIGIAFQAPSLLNALNVNENVALPLLLAGYGSAEASSRSEAMLQRLGLAELSDHLPEELSGGQAQRIALARALVAEPRLLLCDEPTGQVDHTTATSLLDATLGLAAEVGAAVVLATHDPAVAARAGCLWLISDGCVEISKPASDVMAAGRQP